MIRWASEGLLLSRRGHGESSAIVDVFTPDLGRYAGVVRGGGARRMAPVLQPGNQLSVDWSARLETHMGSFKAELLMSRAGLMQDRAALAALQYICGLLAAALPERDPHPELYHATQALLGRLPTQDWQKVLVQWEFLVLSELGFGLDLSRCAVTGASDGLSYVSPKSGRAVSMKGAGEWADRLLPLPPFVQQDTHEGSAEDGLRLTGHFMSAWLFPTLSQPRLGDLRAAMLRASGV